MEKFWIDTHSSALDYNTICNTPILVQFSTTQLQTTPYTTIHFVSMWSIAEIRIHIVVVVVVAAAAAPAAAAAADGGTAQAAKDVLVFPALTTERRTRGLGRF